MTSNKRTFLRAVKWAYVMNCGQQGLTALFSFGLAAIVGPRDFGTLAMAMIYIQFVQIFLEQGLVATLIQRKDLRTEHLDSVFWMGFGLSLALMAVTIVGSPYWAAVNHLPGLAAVICALSLMLPIEGLDIVQRAILQREMDFKSLSIRTNLAVIAGGIPGLVMAFRGFGVWSLVAQKLLQETVALGLLWGLSPWRPGFRCELASLRELWRVSLSNLLSRVGVFFSGQSDGLLMGLFFGPMAVGLYQLANRLMSTVLTTTTGSIQIVSLPQFSRFQHQPAELRESVLACIRLTAIVSVPALVGLSVVSRPLMRVLGRDWAQATNALQILTVVGIVMTFQYLIGPLLQAVSKPHQAAAMVWAHGAISVVTLVAAGIFLKSAAIERQVFGIATVRLVVAFFFFVPVIFYFLSRICQISVFEFAQTVAPSFASSAAIAAAVYLVRASHLFAASALLALTMDVLVGSVVGVGLMLALDHRLRETVRVAVLRWLHTQDKEIPGIATL
jgi:O-antigen/teichoic acid export membrane protein